jgi:hypothetical protein
MRVLTQRQSSSIACHSTLTLLDFVRSLERFAVTSARYKGETNPAAWSFALASVPFASTAEVVFSEVARNSGLAQVRATARLVQSIFLFSEVLTSARSKQYSSINVQSLLLIKCPPYPPPYFFPLRQSHYDYVAELLFSLVLWELGLSVGR